MAEHGELDALVERALALVNRRLGPGAAGSGTLESVRVQLEWIRTALDAPDPPDPERVDELLLGVYAAREFETTDPELAELLFEVEYRFRRVRPEADEVIDPPVPAPTPLTVSLRDRVGPDEEIVATTAARRAGPDETLPKKFAVVVTTQRLLVFGLGGLFPKAREIVFEASLEEIEADPSRPMKATVRTRHGTVQWGTSEFWIVPALEWARSHRRESPPPNSNR